MRITTMQLEEELEGKPFTTKKPGRGDKEEVENKMQNIELSTHKLYERQSERVCFPIISIFYFILCTNW